MIDAILIGKRQNDRDVYILLFDSSKTDPNGRIVIHRYIKQCLQKYIDQIKV
jgi:hypothetical protein